MSIDQISPKLIGEKVILGPFREDLGDTYRRWLHDPENSYGLQPALLLTHAHETDWLNANVKPNGAFFTIYEKQTETPMGTVTLINLDAVNRHAELGIVIGEKGYKSKGFGRESIMLILDYGFNILNLECIYLRVHSYNAKAIGLYESIGFVRTGVRRHACYMAGHYYDDILMDILHDEFKGKHIQQHLDNFINATE